MLDCIILPNPAWNDVHSSYETVTSETEKCSGWKLRFGKLPTQVHQIWHFSVEWTWVSHLTFPQLSFLRSKIEIEIVPGQREEEQNELKELFQVPWSGMSSIPLNTYCFIILFCPCLFLFSNMLKFLSVSYHLIWLENVFILGWAVNQVTHIRIPGFHFDFVPSLQLPAHAGSGRQQVTAQADGSLQPV